MANLCKKLTVISFLVRSKIWVALAALMMTVESSYMLQQNVNWLGAAHVFFITLTGYLFLDHAHADRRKPLVYIALTCVILGFLIMPDQNYLLLSICAGLVGTYSLDWISPARSFKFLEWRKIPMVKNAVIALTWVLLTIGLNLKYSDWLDPHVLMFGLVHFLFICALSIAEDIIDQQHDFFKTIPSIYGTKSAKVISFIISALAMLLYFFNAHDTHIAAVALTVIPLLLLIFLFISPKGKRDPQSFIIDGVIITKSLLICFWCFNN